MAPSRPSTQIAERTDEWTEKYFQSLVLHSTLWCHCVKCVSMLSHKSPHIQPPGLRAPSGSALTPKCRGSHGLLESPQQPTNDRGQGIHTAQAPLNLIEAGSQPEPACHCPTGSLPPRGSSALVGSSPVFFVPICWPTTSASHKCSPQR